MNEERSVEVPAPLALEHQTEEKPAAASEEMDLIAARVASKADAAADIRSEQKHLGQGAAVKNTQSPNEIACNEIACNEAEEAESNDLEATNIANLQKFDSPVEEELTSSVNDAYKSVPGDTDDITTAPPTLVEEAIVGTEKESVGAPSRAIVPAEEDDMETASPRPGEGEEATVFAVQTLLVGDLPCAEEDASDYDEDVDDAGSKDTINIVRTSNPSEPKVDSSDNESQSANALAKKLHEEISDDTEENNYIGDLFIDEAVEGSVQHDSAGQSDGSDLLQKSKSNNVEGKISAEAPEVAETLSDDMEDEAELEYGELESKSSQEDEEFWDCITVIEEVPSTVEDEPHCIDTEVATISVPDLEEPFHDCLEEHTQPVPKVNEVEDEAEDLAATIASVPDALIDQVTENQSPTSLPTTDEGARNVEEPSRLSSTSEDTASTDDVRNDDCIKSYDKPISLTATEDSSDGAVGDNLTTTAGWRGSIFISSMSHPTRFAVGVILQNGSPDDDVEVHFLCDEEDLSTVFGRLQRIVQKELGCVEKDEEGPISMPQERAVLLRKRASGVTIAQLQQDCTTFWEYLFDNVCDLCCGNEQKVAAYESHDEKNVLEGYEQVHNPNAISVNELCRRARKEEVVGKYAISVPIFPQNSSDTVLWVPLTVASAPSSGTAADAFLAGDECAGEALSLWTNE